MAKILTGDRIGKLGTIRFACCATIYDKTKKEILLTRRSDNHQWCLPGGAMNPGESIIEACKREVMEETGLHVDINRLIGIYSDPNRIIEYSDGNRYHMVTVNFEADITGGDITIGNETIEIGYFSLLEIERLEVMPHHYERILDSFSGQNAPFIR